MTFACCEFTAQPQSINVKRTGPNRLAFCDIANLVPSFWSIQVIVDEYGHVAGYTRDFALRPCLNLQCSATSSTTF